MSFLNIYRWIGYSISLSLLAYGGYLYNKERTLKRYGFGEYI